MWITFAAIHAKQNCDHDGTHKCESFRVGLQIHHASLHPN
jgi:hypothetical protein